MGWVVNRVNCCYCVDYGADGGWCVGGMLLGWCVVAVATGERAMVDCGVRIARDL